VFSGLPTPSLAGEGSSGTLLRPPDHERSARGTSTFPAGRCTDPRAGSNEISELRCLIEDLHLQLEEEKLTRQSEVESGRIREEELQNQLDAIVGPDGQVKRAGVVDYLNEKITDVTKEFSNYQKEAGREIARLKIRCERLEATDEKLKTMNSELLEENAELLQRCNKLKRKAQQISKRNIDRMKAAAAADKMEECG